MATMLESLLAPFAAISIAELALIAVVPMFASVIGGAAGTGTGALMPLVLGRTLGPEPVVAIIAISGLFNSAWRMLAFWTQIDWRRAMLVAAFASPTCMISAYGYTFLTGRGAMLVIGGM